MGEGDDAVGAGVVGCCVGAHCGGGFVGFVEYFLIVMSSTEMDG